MDTQREALFGSILRCPNPACLEGVMLAPITEAQRNSLLQCERCGARFPIVDGMPLLVFPVENYIARMRQNFDAMVSGLETFQATVGTDDPYFDFANIWRDRAIGCRDDMLSASEALAGNQGKTDSSRVESPSPSATDTFKAEYSAFETIEEYLKSAYGIYLQPPGGNREGFYATVLSAGKALPRDATILDVGCGVGRTLLDFSQLCSDGLVIGLDFVYGMLKMTRSVVLENEPVPLLLKTDMRQHEIRTLQGFGRLNVALVAADAQRLPFADATFDCILGNYIYSIIDDYQAALREAVRLLKPGGMFILTNGYSWEDLREPERRHNPDDLSTTMHAADMRIELDFDFANVNNANPRLGYLRTTRLTLARKSL